MAWRDGVEGGRLRPGVAVGLLLLAGSAVAGTLLLRALARPGPDPLPQPAVVVRDEPLVVHVAGRVARPGLYRLAPGARVAEALEAAGGALPDALLDAVNLARPLEDGEQLLVPGPGPPEGAAAGRTGEPAGARRPDGRLDLNRASAAELEALPGIGPVLAGRIVAWRERHGAFRSVRDLRRVQGIGEKLYRSLAELVAV